MPLDAPWPREHRLSDADLSRTAATARQMDHGLSPWVLMKGLDLPSAVDHPGQVVGWPKAWDRSGAIDAGVMRKFNPYHVPAGSPEGGQFTDASGAGGGHAPSQPGVILASTGNSPAAKPITHMEGKTVVIEYPDGTMERREGGSRAWRNHNPGNLVYGPTAKALGAIGSDGSLAIFPDDETGYKAMEETIKTKYKDCTINRMIEIRSPKKDGNDPVQIQADVHRLTGIDMNKKTDDLTPAEIAQICRAFTITEGWKEGKVSHAKKA